MIQFDNAVTHFGKVILDELKKNDIKAYIAGGSVRDYFMSVKMKTDYDIFFHSEEEFIKAFEFFKSEECDILFESDNAVKISHRNKKFDLVRHHFASPEDMIKSFDFTVSMFAVDNERVYHGETSFIDLSKRQLMLNDILIYPNNTMKRAFRYYEKGFRMCVGEMHKLSLAITSFNNEAEEKKKSEEKNSEAQNATLTLFEPNDAISSPDDNGFFVGID